MEINLKESREFQRLISGKFLNPSTTGAFLREVFAATIGPSGIAVAHFAEGQGKWKNLSPDTLLDPRKKDKRKFYNSGRVFKAISTPATGKIRDWGSSADIYTDTAWRPKRYSANGIYATARVNTKGAWIKIGFNGKYGHSSAFNKIRKALATEIMSANPALQQLYGGKKMSLKTARKIVSVGGVERRLNAINADRAERGLKKIKKTQQRGALGIRGGKMELARGKDNLAYADIVQRGEFLGLHGENDIFYGPRRMSSVLRAKGKGGLPKGKAVFTKNQGTHRKSVAKCYG
jgi:hypothetical protein